MEIRLFEERTEDLLTGDSIDISLLLRFIDPLQAKKWISLFNGQSINEQLIWKGSLQEAYFLFNEIRKKTLKGDSRIKIKTKNRGLDWIKINKVIKTRIGKIQKESRPHDISIIDESLIIFINLI